MAFTSKEIPDLEDKDPIADFKTWADLMIGQSGGYGVPGQYKQIMDGIYSNMALGNSQMVQVPYNHKPLYPGVDLISQLIDEDES